MTDASLLGVATPRLAYSVAEVAQLLDVHEDTVRRWIRAGELHAKQVNDRGRVMVPAAALEDFLA